ncbi:hypothetical protein [Corynebacterium sphenisci]|uniref:hypothetical protein n=1 Tax=Corynebacterium sphenisci TaxID=191493 RepID=UPI0012F50D13|nr:hypothetical protein [Corynebacterium sphenisci]
MTPATRHRITRIGGAIPPASPAGPPHPGGGPGHGRPVEKGIDVLCALEVIRQCRRDGVDLVILASRDTDLIPVLDEAFDRHQEDPDHCAKIETVTWYDRGSRRWYHGHLRPSGNRRIWNTNLDRRVYEASLDRRPH